MQLVVEGFPDCSHTGNSSQREISDSSHEGAGQT